MLLRHSATLSVVALALFVNAQGCVPTANPYDPALTPAGSSGGENYGWSSMEGNHPFAGVFRGAGEPPGLEENIRTRRSPYFGRGPLEPPPAAPPIELLGPELAGLLRKPAKVALELADGIKPPVHLEVQVNRGSRAIQRQPG